MKTRKEKEKDSNCQKVSSAYIASGYNYNK